MRVIKEKIEVDVAKYISFDGKDFGENRYACICYERKTLKELRERQLLDNEHIIYCRAADGLHNFDGEECMDCHIYKWFFIKDKEGVDIISQLYPEETHKVGSFYNDNLIGHWICVETHCDDDSFYWLSTLDDGFNEVNKIIRTLNSCCDKKYPEYPINKVV